MYPTYLAIPSALYIETAILAAEAMNEEHERRNELTAWSECEVKVRPLYSQRDTDRTTHHTLRGTSSVLQLSHTESWEHLSSSTEGTLLQNVTWITKWFIDADSNTTLWKFHNGTDQGEHNNNHVWGLGRTWFEALRQVMRCYNPLVCWMWWPQVMCGFGWCAASSWWLAGRRFCTSVCGAGQVR